MLSLEHNMCQIKKHRNQSHYNKIYQQHIACTGKCILRKEYVFPKCLHFVPDVRE